MGSGRLPVGFRRSSCFWAPADLLNLYVVVLSLWKYVIFPPGAFGLNCITAAVYASPNVCGVACCWQIFFHCFTSFCCSLPTVGNNSNQNQFNSRG